MSHLDDLTRTFEAMSMSSIVTDIATPPPPPPPLELERWRTLSKTMNSKRSGFFTRHFDFKNEEKPRVLDKDGPIHGHPPKSEHVQGTPTQVEDITAASRSGSYGSAP